MQIVNQFHEKSVRAGLPAFKPGIFFQQPLFRKIPSKLPVFVQNLPDAAPFIAINTKPSDSEQIRGNPDPPSILTCAIAAYQAETCLR